MTYRVHTFFLVRAAVTVGAVNQLGAIEAAVKKLHLTQLVRQNSPPGAIELEFADEISHYMVDELVDGQVQYDDSAWFMEDDGEAIPIVNGRWEPVLVADIDGEKITVHCNTRKCTLYILDRSNGVQRCIEGKDMCLDPELQVMNDFAAEYGDGQAEGA